MENNGMLFSRVNGQNYEALSDEELVRIIKDGDILWFIPLSSKIQKYRNIYNNKIRKYEKS